MAANARHRTSTTRIWGSAPANAASVRGVAAARAALLDGSPGPTGDDAIALLEQQRREVATPQPALPLRGGGR